MQDSTVQCRTVQCRTVQYSAGQYSAGQYSKVQDSTVLDSIVQCSAVQYSAVQYSAGQYSAVFDLVRVSGQSCRSGGGASILSTIREREGKGWLIKEFPHMLFSTYSQLNCTALFFISLTFTKLFTAHGFPQWCFGGFFRQAFLLIFFRFSTR